MAGSASESVTLCEENLGSEPTEADPSKNPGVFSKTCFVLLKPALFLANETGDFSKTPAAVLVKIAVFTKILVLGVGYRKRSLS